VAAPLGALIVAYAITRILDGPFHPPDEFLGAWQLATSIWFGYVPAAALLGGFLWALHRDDEPPRIDTSD
jgi:hypothetical protein